MGEAPPLPPLRAPSPPPEVEEGRGEEEPNYIPLTFTEKWYQFSAGAQRITTLETGLRYA